jgi:predicted lactoylglutathione lyase
MPDNYSRKIFVNLAIRELKRSMEFFAKLGFGFDQRFRGDKRPARLSTTRPS